MSTQYLVTDDSGSRKRNYDSSELFSNLPENLAALCNEVTVVFHVDGHRLLDDVVLKDYRNILINYYSTSNESNME